MHYLLRSDVFDKFLLHYGNGFIRPFNEAAIRREPGFIYYNEYAGWCKLRYRYFKLFIKNHLPEVKMELTGNELQLITIESRADLDELVRESLGGAEAYRSLRRRLLNHYTAEEFDECLRQHQATYDPDLIQVHFNWNSPDNLIHKFEDCYKWDINGAHTDAVIEIFPKAREELLELYSHRHDPIIGQRIKDEFNLFVGYLKHLGDKNPNQRFYTGTYHWIVQRTTKILLKAIATVGGKLIYANTDGFMVQHPTTLLNHSTTLGEFKLEFQGTGYYFKDRNYFLFQTDEKQFGNCRIEVRSSIDLSIGHVVHYSTQSKAINSTQTIREVYNQQEEIIDVKSEL